MNIVPRSKGRFPAPAFLRDRRPRNSTALHPRPPLRSVLCEPLPTELLVLPGARGGCCALLGSRALSEPCTPVSAGMPTSLLPTVQPYILTCKMRASILTSCPGHAGTFCSPRSTTKADHRVPRQREPRFPTPGAASQFAVLPGTNIRQMWPGRQNTPWTPCRVWAGC